VTTVATIHALMSRPVAYSSAVGRFADLLLARDLPALAESRRAEAVAFIERRVAGLPSITKLGVEIISRSVDLVGRVSGPDRMVALTTKLTLPLLSEYPRLVRSLGFAFVWESWPDTAPDGAPS